jgi:hypothetical protein
MSSAVRIPVVSTFAVLSFLAASPAARAQHLDENQGVVRGNPEIHNLYMSGISTIPPIFSVSWDNPSESSQGNIDAFTQQLVNGSYFSSAAQYGVTNPSFTGSHDNFALCPLPIIAGVTDFLAIVAWMECETLPGPIPYVYEVLSNIPKASDNTIYAVYLSTGTQINDLAFSTCGSFGAYHFFGGTVVWDSFLGVPYLRPQDFAYAVIPTECGNGGTIDGVTELATHELIETATDPITPVVPLGWIDNSTYDWTGDVLSKGEAADICELGVGAAGTGPVRMTDGLLVAPYWSNADAKCVPVTRTFRLAETGLPGSVPHEATFDGGPVSLPFSTVVDDGSTHSYAFPSPVNDPNPGIRYVTSEPPATVVVTANFSKTAVYTTQYWLDVSATPPPAQPLDASLTPSDWIDAGQTVTLTTDPLISLGPDSRYRFDSWTGTFGSTASTFAIPINAPTSEVANYVLQWLVTVATSGLGGNYTHVTNNGSVIGVANDSNPLSVFQDEGPFALGADANVYGANAVQYFFQGFSPAAPSTLSGAFSTTAVYATMAQLIQQALASGGIYGPGAAGLANSLLMQWAAVEADLAAGNYARALADLQSFISHIQAQTGVHIMPVLARTLELDAAMVFHSAECLAVSAGQLDAAGAANAYAYYSALVTALGGSVQPAC